MLVLILGVAAGLFLALGPVVWLHRSTDSLSGNLITTGNDLFSRAISAIPGTEDYPNVVTLLAVSLALTLPGMLAVILAWCANTSGRSSRSSAAAVFVVVAVAGFFVLGFGQAVLMALFAIAGAVLVVSPLHRVTAVAALALATMMAADAVRSVVTANNPHTTRAAETIEAITSLQGAGLWSLAAVLLLLGPFVAAVAVLFRGLDHRYGRDGDRRRYRQDW